MTVVQANYVEKLATCMNAMIEHRYMQRLKMHLMGIFSHPLTTDTVRETSNQAHSRPTVNMQIKNCLLITTRSQRLQVPLCLATT